jgi:hypothetical protein
MQSKRIHILVLLVAVLLLAFLAGGCGKSGTKRANIAPTITITSYEGFDDSALLAPYANTTFSFQQKIYWSATDPDGVITGFAYRVLDQNDNPIATPGNDFIDATGAITPKNVLDKYGPGWVMHYLPNANQDIPLDSPDARRSIWTSQKYAVINFPAADANGDSLITLSKFEVIAVDNRGEITQEAAWRKFNAASARPKMHLSTSKGNPNGDEVGSGIKLTFNMEDFDPFISAVPHRYEFKMMKIKKKATTGDNYTETVIPGSQTEWINTVQPDDPVINEYLLTRYTSPALSYDVLSDDENEATYTKVIARVYDLAGVVSAKVDSIHFAVKSGFAPQTLIYHQKVYALGDNHYVDYTDENSPEIYPFTIVGGQQRFATSFFRDFEGGKTAVTSTNMKVWVRWGWNGEYGKVLESGAVQHTNNPYDKKIDDVLDRNGDNYFSEITHFDLRYDGDEYEYAPYANDPSRHVVDTDGTRWLRIPLHSPIGQTVVLTFPKTTAGTHTFEVRCVDLQGEVDPEPQKFTFNLVDFIPPEQRNGVLIIDDDSNGSDSPDALVDAKYAHMLSDYTGPKIFKKRPGETETSQLDDRRRYLSPTELQKYKLVVYHNDRPSQKGYLKFEHDGLYLFLSKGGNLMVSSTTRLAEDLEDFAKSNHKTFLAYFGLPFIGSPAEYVSTSLNNRPYMQKAKGQEAYPDISLQCSALSPDGTPSFNTLVENLHGLSSVSYFKESTATVPNLLLPGTSVVYRLGCKPVDYTPRPPTAEEFARYNDRAVGIRNTTASGGRTWMFGFPLSYMYDDHAKAMMNKVLGEI